MQTEEHGGAGGLGMRLEETPQYAEVKILGFPSYPVRYNQDGGGGADLSYKNEHKHLWSLSHIHCALACAGR